MATDSIPTVGVCMNVAVFARVRGERGRGYRTRGCYHLNPISSRWLHPPYPVAQPPGTFLQASFRLELSEGLLCFYRGVNGTVRRITDGRN